jgi:hypothetical protein
MQTDHPRDIQLLNYSQGLQIEKSLADHIQNCPTCQNKLLELEKEKNQINQMLRPQAVYSKFIEEHQAKKQKRRSLITRLVPAGLIPLALVIALFFSSGKLKDQAHYPSYKGSLSVQLYVKRNDKVIKADESIRVHPGDKIRLGVLSPEAVRITILAQQANKLQPIKKLTDIPIVAGQEQILPGSLLIDCEEDTEIIQVKIKPTLAKKEPNMPELQTKTILLTCEAK